MAIDINRKASLHGLGHRKSFSFCPRVLPLLSTRGRSPWRSTVPDRSNDSLDTWYASHQVPKIYRFNLPPVVAPLLHAEQDPLGRPIGSAPFPIREGFRKWAWALLSLRYFRFRNFHRQRMGKSLRVDPVRSFPCCRRK